MAINSDAYKVLKQELDPLNVSLIAVSKMKSIADINALYQLGQRDFGENYVQELMEKQAALPADIRWHFIGHLQKNKVKYIAPFIHLIHSVDSENLLKEINKEAKKNNRNIQVLLQMYIAEEETKFGMDADEINELIAKRELYSSVMIIGLMGMASFSENEEQVKKEFNNLKKSFEQNKSAGLSIISTGMSNDYRAAIKEGSNMVRIGSLLFGRR